jgi:hypothetical protein
MLDAMTTSRAWRGFDLDAVDVDDHSLEHHRRLP